MKPQLALEALQGAVWAPQSWPDALDAAGAACAASIVTIVNGARSGDLVASRSGAPLIDAYLHREIPDSREARVNPILAQGFRTDYDDFAPRDIERDPYYQDFLAPLGLRWHAVAALPGFGDETMYISFKRSPRQGMFERADVDTLNAMLPQIRWLVRQAATLRRARFDGELAAFSRVNRGALMLDVNGAILAVNDRVVFGDGLRSDGNRLGAALVEDRDRLQSAVATALAGAGPAPPLIVRRPSGKRPYVLDVLSLPAGLITDPTRSCALVVILDPDAVLQPRREVLRIAFGLTPRETDVALLLAAGKSLAGAAAALHISENHARQRVKSLFDKTGTGNQGDLKALLVRLS